MAQSKSYHFNKESSIWIEPSSAILNHIFPIEYIYGDWYQWIAEGEANRSDSEYPGCWKNDVIVTGSRAEGFCINKCLVRKDDTYTSLDDTDDWQPDVDLMKSYDPFVIDKETAIPIFTVQFVKENPRYVKLLLTDEYKDYCVNYKEHVFLNHGYLFPSPYMNELVEMLNKSENAKRDWEYEIHGPVRKMKSSGNAPNYESDDTNVFKYPQSWPEPAMQWIDRHRNGSWPTPELIQEVYKSGCHIAPVGREKRSGPSECENESTASPSTSNQNQAESSLDGEDSPIASGSQDPHQSKHESTMDETEWRLSFSVAENILGQSVTPAQRHIIVLLKMLKKLYFPGVVSSYHLKNLIFWEIEKNDASFWNEDNTGSCLVHMLYRLEQCLENGFLQHYIIPESNLLENEDKSQLAVALTEVSRVRKNILQSFMSMIKRVSIMSFMSLTFHIQLDLAPFIPKLQESSLQNNNNCEILGSILQIFSERYKKCLQTLSTFGEDKSLEREVAINTNIYESLLARTLTKLWFLEGGNSAKNDFLAFIKAEMQDCCSQTLLDMSQLFYEQSEKEKDMTLLIPTVMKTTKDLQKKIAQDNFEEDSRPIKELISIFQTGDCLRMKDILVNLGLNADHIEFKKV